MSWARSLERAKSLIRILTHQWIQNVKHTQIWVWGSLASISVSARRHSLSSSFPPFIQTSIHLSASVPSAPLPPLLSSPLLQSFSARFRLVGNIHGHLSITAVLISDQEQLWGKPGVTATVELRNFSFGLRLWRERERKRSEGTSWSDTFWTKNWNPDFIFLLSVWKP